MLCSEFYLSSSSCYFVNDVCEDDVLIVSIRTHFLPLWILSESDIVAKERVTNTEKKMVNMLVEITRSEFQYNSRYKVYVKVNSVTLIRTLVIICSWMHYSKGFMVG